MEIPSSQSEKIVYYSRAMEVFGERMISEMGYKQYNSQTDLNKKVFFQGLYFNEDYEVLKRHRGEKIIYFNGSDAKRLLMSLSWMKTLLSTKATFLCQSTWNLPLLRAIGIKVKHYPIFFGNLKKLKVSYKQSDKPHMFMTSHTGRDKEYGIDKVLRVAPQVPDITFHIFGSEGENLDNVIYHGWIEEKEMDKQIRTFQGAIKGGSNGVSETLAKSIMMGQYPISYKKIDGVWYAPTDEEFMKFLNKVKKMKEPNLVLRDKYLNYYKSI
ncbi:TPA: hypothetical protein DEP90_01665 [Patescibacteria group bacterium]|nr:hypothetical protein [Patescibacteria group bacterium]